MEGWMNLYDAGVFWGPQNDASDEKGFSDTLGNLTSSNWQCHL